MQTTKEIIMTEIMDQPNVVDIALDGGDFKNIDGNPNDPQMAASPSTSLLTLDKLAEEEKKAIVLEKEKRKEKKRKLKLIPSYI